MYELKTKITDGSVKDFLDSVSDEKKRADAYIILDIMREITGDEPKMWGDSIIGFGTFHYRYASGQEGDWMQTGFSPRKQNLTIYLLSGIKGFSSQLADLGKHSTGKSCLYIRRLDDIKLDVLREIIKQSVDTMKHTPEKREY
jgi:hypothetical protein